MKLAEIIDSDRVVALSNIKLDRELVRQVQERLSVLGFYHGAVDSIWGEKTLNAVAQFCSEHYLNNADTGQFGAMFAIVLLKDDPIQLISKFQVESIFDRQITDDQIKDLNNCLLKFEINTPVDIRMFIATTAHESGSLKWVKEIASGSAYEGRKDLGNLKPGWGKLYKGSGCLQLTGRKNYEAFSSYMKDPKILELGCDYVARHYVFSSGGFWWMRNCISKKITNGATFQTISALVNGKNPANGIQDRMMYYKRACQVI